MATQSQRYTKRHQDDPTCFKRWQKDINRIHQWNVFRLISSCKMTLAYSKRTNYLGAWPPELLELCFIGGTEDLELCKGGGQRRLRQSIQSGDARGQPLHHRHELLDKCVNLLQGQKNKKKKKKKQHLFITARYPTCKQVNALYSTVHFHLFKLACQFWKSNIFIAFTWTQTLSSWVTVADLHVNSAAFLGTQFFFQNFSIWKIKMWFKMLNNIHSS